MSNVAFVLQQSTTTDHLMSDKPQTDHQLVSRVQRGDRRAFDLLVIKYQPKILSLIGRFVYDQSECQDVAQEAFIKAYRALPNFRGDSQFYTWLYRIAVNTAKNYLVSRGRKAPTQGVDPDEAETVYQDAAFQDSATPERILQRDRLKEVVFTAIADLPEELRIAVSLREMDGMSYEEIAEVMDCPIGTVRSRIFRAREAIEKKMQPYLEASA